MDTLECNRRVFDRRIGARVTEVSLNFALTLQPELEPLRTDRHLEVHLLCVSWSLNRKVRCCTLRQSAEHKLPIRIGLGGRDGHIVPSQSNIAFPQRRVTTDQVLEACLRVLNRIARFVHNLARDDTRHCELNLNIRRVLGGQVLPPDCVIRVCGNNAYTIPLLELGTRKFKAKRPIYPRACGRFG